MTTTSTTIKIKKAIGKTGSSVTNNDKKNGGLSSATLFNLTLEYVLRNIEEVFEAIVMEGEEMDTKITEEKTKVMRFRGEIAQNIKIGQYKFETFKYLQVYMSNKGDSRAETKEKIQAANRIL